MIECVFIYQEHNNLERVLWNENLSYPTLRNALKCSCCVFLYSAHHHLNEFWKKEKIFFIKIKVIAICNIQTLRFSLKNPITIALLK